jgi:peptide/nickel transport system substrate-binding protein
LAAVGLEARAQVISTSEYDQRIAKRDMGAPVFLMRNSNGFSPASALVSRPELVATNNVSHFTSPEYTAAVDAVAGALTDADRQQALRDYNAFALDQAFNLNVVTRPSLTVRTSEFDGVTPTFQGFLDVSSAYLTDQ